MVNYKVILAAIGAAFFFGLGWRLAPDPPPVATVQGQHDVQVKTVDHVVTRTVTVRERAPNGTTKETKTVDVAETKDRTKGAETRSAQVVAPLRSDPPGTWSVGAEWQPRLSPDVYKPVSAELGYRVGGPVWVTGSWNWQTHTALVGARTEF